jgi:hypothetical protein
MRSPHNKQSPRPHPFQHLGEDLPLLLTRSSNERSDIHDVKITEVVLRAACAIAAESHRCFGDSEALTKVCRRGDGVEAPVYVEDEGLAAGLE